MDADAQVGYGVVASSAKVLCYVIRDGAPPNPAILITVEPAHVCAQALPDQVVGADIVSPRGSGISG